MRENFYDGYKQFYCYLVEIVEAGFQLIIIYYTVRWVSYSMSNTESKPKDEEEEEENNNAVLPQIGEDPGLPADAIEQDSKARADKKHKQEKGKDLPKSKE